MHEPVNSIGMDGPVLDQVQQFVALFIAADAAGDIHLASQGHQVVGHVGGAAQRQVLGLGFQDRDRRFGRDPVDRTPDVFVQDQIPHHQYLGAFLVIEEMFEFGFQLIKILVEYFANDMPDGDVRFLNTGGFRRGNDEGQIDPVF